MSSQFHFHSPLLQPFPIPTSKPLTKFPPSLSNLPQLKAANFISRAQPKRKPKPLEKPQSLERQLLFDEEENYNGEQRGEEEEEEEEEFTRSSAYRGRVDERDYDRDPEFAEILGSCLDDPQKAQSKVKSC